MESVTTVYTRFPPEPNADGLHFGHLKAMMFDFLEHANCLCYLRLDDTNPETECLQYVDSIIYDVTWLGFKPFKTTYTSDYFQILYDYAIEFIKNGKAYVDLTRSEDLSDLKRNGIIICCNIIPEKPKSVKGIIHWVALEDSVECDFILYDNSNLSIQKYRGRVEKSALFCEAEQPIQFERLGFFKRINTMEIPTFMRVCELVDHSR
jgi:hypothetical protein